ncbi:hypothetical protein GFS31_29850 [Leptolyngbya sp. BL0902]|nr:hypothetical protein GFS31_29850 [Leptolyngbya sp. BL0902]
MATGDHAAIITPLGTVLGSGQRLFRLTAGDFGKLGYSSLTRARGIRSVRTDAHGNTCWLHGKSCGSL